MSTDSMLKSPMVSISMNDENQVLLLTSFRLFEDNSFICIMFRIYAGALWNASIKSPFLMNLSHYIKQVCFIFRRDITKTLILTFMQ